VREPSIRAVAVLSTGRADEGIGDQRQSPSCRRTGHVPSGWIGAKGWTTDDWARRRWGRGPEFRRRRVHRRSSCHRGQGRHDRRIRGAVGSRRGDRPGSLGRRAGRGAECALVGSACLVLVGATSASWRNG